jgi:hypothetical protein
VRYEGVRELSPEAFKRLTGVKPEVFEKMVGVLREAEVTKKKAGRTSKLCLEDKLLLAMSYWREYRTQFHIAASYGVHEATANRIITHVEDMLIKSDKFSLPKCREVSESDWIVVLVDATETPIERPQKNKNATTAARKSATPLKAKS